MKIHILGAHNIETKSTYFNSILIDDVLAIDAGALNANLTLDEQQNLKAILLTHQHYDHIKDLPLLGLNLHMLRKTIEIYTTKHVYDTLAKHIFDEALYPDFTKRPPEKPTLHFNFIEPGKTEQIYGYGVLTTHVNHAVPTVGYQITSPEGKKIFISSDTGPGLEECWEEISPNLMVIETTVSNRDEEFALKTGHLTPALLQKELESFQKIKGYLPQVFLVHLNPLHEKEIKAEISAVEEALKTKISLGYEGMKINI